MYSSWVSIVIALGLILAFYYTRRLRNVIKHRSQKSAALPKGIFPRKKENHLKLGNKTYLRGIAIPVFSNKLGQKKKKVSTPMNLNRTASLLLHPHSIEQARLRYLAYASSFQGLYEPLYQASEGKMKESAQKDLFKSWEHKIKATQSQHLELVWRSSVHSAISSKAPGFENVFRIWLKYLNDWGLQRSVETGRICWCLDGNILEQSIQESEKSI